MKRLAALLLLVFALSLPLFCSSSVSTSEREELKEIVAELKSLNEEQAQIIERSQKRNEELEKQSETKQKIIDEQNKTIEELKSSSKEQKKSSILTVIESIAAALLAFFAGCVLGKIFI